ncbi:hypothetical protein BX666DRAFT_2012224 [Dichotomocladium elegans]|nr:hypothetical protein BX666DRAFT_2012224 [Dichotomocladium elegans]
MAKVSDKVLRENNLRPYNGECTGSRSISAVKPHLAQSVLWSGTTWEYCVL